MKKNYFQKWKQDQKRKKKYIWKKIIKLNKDIKKNSLNIKDISILIKEKLYFQEKMIL